MLIDIIGWVSWGPAVLVGILAWRRRNPVKCHGRTYRNEFTYTLHEIFAHGLGLIVGSAMRHWDRLGRKDR